MLLGSHVSAAGGVHKAIERATSVGCDVVQIFTKNNNRWAAKPLDDQVIGLWHEAYDASGLHDAISHASYLINLASPDDALFQKSIDSLIDELERANALGLSGVVVHPGAFTSSSVDEGLDRIVAGTSETLSRVQPGSARLLLENTAGQGSCLGHDIEQLAQLVDRIDAGNRLGICLDTCHAFAAGYDLRDVDGLADFRNQIQDRFPDHCVHALHLNDSKKPLGSRVDRHEHIGRGELGLDAFRQLVNDDFFSQIPGYLETEKGTDEESGRDWDEINLEVLRGLIAS